MESLLNKYTDTIREIEYICNEVVILQKITNTRIKKESNTKKKKEIYKEFLEYIDEIKNNKKLKDRYKKLKKKEKKLHNEIMDTLCNNDKKNVLNQKNIEKHNKKYEKKENFDNKKCDEKKCCESLNDNSSINKISGIMNSIINKYKNFPQENCVIMIKEIDNESESSDTPKYKRRRKQKYINQSKNENIISLMNSDCEKYYDKNHRKTIIKINKSHKNHNYKHENSIESLSLTNTSTQESSSISSESILDRLENITKKKNINIKKKSKRGNKKKRTSSDDDKIQMRKLNTMINKMKYL